MEVGGGGGAGVGGGVGLADFNEEPQLPYLLA